MKKKGVVRSKVCFLPNGVDVTLFVPQLPDKDRVCQLGLEGKYIFAYTGTHGYAQGLDVIIDAAYKLCHRSDIAFLFVGEGPEKQRLQNMVQKMKPQNVVFIDAQPAEMMPQILALATACLVPLRDLPLFRDARPSKMFPPLGCARPVIYSGAGEAANLIEQAECGIVTPPENGQALAEAVIYMIEHPDEVVEMGQRGRALVEREYGKRKLLIVPPSGNLGVSKPTSRASEGAWGEQELPLPYRKAEGNTHPFCVPSSSGRGSTKRGRADQGMD